MVRVKSRWMILRIDFERDLVLVPSSQKRQLSTITTDYYSTSGGNGGSNSNTDSYFPSKRELETCIRDQVLTSFGEASGGAVSSSNMQVRFCDPNSRLIIMRVSRDYCSLIRSALSFITILKQKYRVTITIQSIHGCARTTKIQMIRTIQNLWRNQLLMQQRITEQQQQQQPPNSTTTTTIPPVISKETHQMCQSIESILNEIVNIGY